MAAPAPAPAPEPPIPDDAELAPPSDDARDGSPLPPDRSVLSHQQRSALEARVRAEAKAHPSVHQVIEALDAELREIRVDSRTLTPPERGTP